MRLSARPTEHTATFFWPHAKADAFFAVTFKAHPGSPQTWESPAEPGEIYDIEIDQCVEIDYHFGQRFSPRHRKLSPTLSQAWVARLEAAVKADSALWDKIETACMEFGRMIATADPRQIAHDAGLSLVRHTEYHWSLRGPGDKPWILNLYPSKGSYHWDAKRGGPRFKLPPGWSIESAVELAITHKSNTPQGDDRLTILVAVVREAIAELEKDAHCEDDDIVFAFLAQKLQRAVDAARKTR